MVEAQKTGEGYLLLADISGYTAFFSSTELDHAQGIIGDLTTIILGALAPPLRLVKLEGDAAFCYAPASSVSDAERLLELVEACYFEFSDRLADMVRSTTCRCAACGSMHLLDLKFVVHYGSFVRHRAAGVEDLAGLDVITVHRLLKNSVVERTGLAAYALLTAAACSRLPASVSLAYHREEYGDIGVVEARLYDLKAALEDMRTRRRDLVTDEEADLVFRHQYPAPAATVWRHFVEPELRMRWQADLKGWENRPNQTGRLGRGAESHCAHGSWDSVARYLDWRPFEYFTAIREPTRKSLRAAPRMKETVEFRPIDGGRTEVVMRWRLLGRGLGTRLLLKVIWPMERRELRSWHQELSRILAADEARAEDRHIEPVHA